ncbi:hypothetical protein JCM19294_1150 [Nonlabens tegetincola]|uniref:Uncharacterized protein n=1 Tax=Nonlabens tegetincola TaxID=323273 RepID=A0A090QMT4_9FLAO|nr:hypothetical protein [Nonlabens tegetincola]GAK96841.1 hypothetical protein JCM19294_1150 [Nonlabens tegetincola]
MKTNYQNNLLGKTYGQLNHEQKQQATRIVLAAYFNSLSNSTTAITKTTGLKHSLVCRIITLEITPGRDLRSLKAQYTLNHKQKAKSLLGLSNKEKQITNN